MFYSDELNFKNYKNISKEQLLEYKHKEIPVLNESQIVKYLKDSEPLNIFIALINLRKLLLLEMTQKKQEVVFNDVDILFNILENYPEEFKYECLVCLTCIEFINLKYKLIVENKPTKIAIKIILYILDNYKDFKLELLEADLDYINILVQVQDIYKITRIEFFYLKLYNLIAIENFNEENIIKKIFEILIKIIKIMEEIEIINNLELVSKVNNIVNKYESNQDLLAVSLEFLSELINIYNQINSNSILKDMMDKMIEINLLQKIINYLDIIDIKNKKNQIFNSLKIIGNFALIEEEYFTDKLIELNILDRLKKLTQNEYPFEIRSETTWIISNIASGSNEQINYLYDNNFSDLLFDYISKEKEGEVKTNCLWALYNFVNINKKEYFIDLIERGLLDILISRLKIDNYDTLALSLEALEKALEKGNYVRFFSLNIIKIKITELNIQNELIDLMNREIPQICINKGMYILEKYFKVDELDLIDTDYEENE